MKCSPEMQEYFDTLEGDTKEIYEFASKVRERGGIDPESEVEVQLAKTLSDRVIGLISVVAPQLKGSDAPERIQELEDEYGILDWRVAFKIAEDVAKEKFCEFESEREAIEVGLRVGFAYVTLGVVSAPIEGLTTLEIKDRRDGEGQYFCLKYSGPVRNAGGTAASVSVLIGDYLRKKFGYAEYDPTGKEVERCHAELRDYHEKVTNLQYFPSEEESVFLMENLPVEIGGEPSERYEVSNVNLKDLSRVETDVIRSGYCLIHSSCLPLKAPKLWKRLEDWGHDFDMEQWDFLEDFLKVQKEQKAGGEGEDSETEVTPDYTYIKDLVSGRPVLGHPLKIGGLRIRYGRARTTGLSAQALHPATMHVLGDFIGVGTQLKTERPGKAASMAVCDSIEGPIVKLRDGSVVRFDTEQEAKKRKRDIKEVLYLGDVLINYGDFYDRAHPLVPPGYCEEFWSAEIEEACVDMFGTLDFEKLSDLTDIDASDLERIFEDPVSAEASFDQAVTLAEKLEVPLHPKYTYFWTALRKEHFKQLLLWMRKADRDEEDGFKVVLPKNKAKRALEVIGVPHVFASQEYVVVKDDHARALLYQLGLLENDLERSYKIARESNQDVLSVINEICSCEVRDKAGTFMGARMGRPEKAKMRKMKGSPHCLCPVGEEGGRLRNFHAAMDEGFVTADFRLYKCGECGKATPHTVCLDCGEKTEKARDCRECGLSTTCDHEEASTYQHFRMDVNKYFQHCLDKLDTKIAPEVIKGVRGTSSKDHDAEHLAKGILRSAHSIHVNKDGTTRYDCSELPLTHFKPSEVSVSVEKLKELGYEEDIDGKELKDPEQVLELKPQDIVIPCSPDSPEEQCDEILYRTTQFLDELLEKIYGTDPFYELDSKEDLVGHYVVGLAPHTSAGMVGRIIGFSKTQGFLAHPLFHSAMRRDCDGDESCLLLLLDAFLNFSPKYLPDSRGGTMDAPLVLTYQLNPSEVDDMVFNMDIAEKYPLELYRAAMDYRMPWEVDVKLMDDVLNTEGQFEGMGYTHEVTSINSGVLCSAYKTLPSMEEKLKGQMALAAKIRAVDKMDVARLVIEKHFIRDTKGNLRKFSQQQFRCVQCNSKFRRPPLVGHCTECGGKVIFTVAEGSVKKYLEPSLSLARKFDVPIYLQQSLELLKRRVEEVFGREKERQEDLGQWFG